MTSDNRQKLLWAPFAALLLFLCLVGCTVSEPPADPVSPMAAPTPDPFPIVLGGERYSGQETALQAVLTAEDVETLSSFPGLKSLDASGSVCYAELLAYAKEHPDVSVLYTVPIGEAVLSSDAEHAELTSLSDPKPLAFLPNLRSLTVSEPLAPQAARKMLSALPDAALNYSVSFAGTVVQNDVTSLDLSAFSPDAAQELVEGLSALPLLNDVRLTPQEGDSSWTLADVGILQAVRPEIKVDYRVTAFRKTFSLADEVVDLSNTPLAERLDELRALLPYLRNVTRLDMENCGIDNESMAALREEFPSPKIVWRVKVGPYSCRTDALMIRFSNYISNRKLNDNDLKALVYCNDMKYMDLGHSDITHPYVVAYMPNLEVCIVAPSKVTDISGFENCKHLEYCELFNCKITDVSPLAGCTELHHLNLCMNKISDISPLYGLTNLERLWISRNPIPQEQIDHMQAIVPDCTINTTAKDPTQNEWRWKRHGDCNFAIRYDLLRKQFLYDRSQNTYSVEPNFD